MKRNAAYLTPNVDMSKVFIGIRHPFNCRSCQHGIHDRGLSFFSRVSIRLEP